MERNLQLLIMMIDKRKTGGFFVMALGCLWSGSGERSFPGIIVYGEVG
jgi:hypothetical protein